MADPFAHARAQRPAGAPAHPHAPAPVSSDPFGQQQWHTGPSTSGSASQWSSPPAPAGVSGPTVSGWAQPGSMGTMGRPQRGPDVPAAFPAHPVAPAAQPSQVAPQSGFFNPAAVLAAAAGGGSTSDMVTNQVAMLAMHKGQELMTSSVAKYLPGAMALWRSLRYYFRVNNTYVRTKLTRVLFPFTHKKWQRAPPSSADEEGPYAPPASDSNAPDLYIPLMAFVTYVLATGLLQGIGMKFHPEVLSDVMSRSVVLLTLEVLLLRGAMYLVGVPNVHLLDLIAFGGYKFVGLVLNMLAGIFFGRAVYFAVFCYNALAIFWFIMNTLVHLLRPELSDAGARPLSKAQVTQRNYLAIVAALLQCALMFWMGSSPPASATVINTVG